LARVSLPFEGPARELPTTPQPTPREARRSLTSEEIVARTERSVALVRGAHSGGTGFLVRPGVLVTNTHVIESEPLPALRVSFPSAPAGQREARVVGLLREESGRDLAFLSVDTTLPPLEL